MKSSHIYISEEGATQLAKVMENNIDGKDYYWTSDKNVELPIFVNSVKEDNFPPLTLLDILEKAVATFPDLPMLQEYDKINQKWVALTYSEAYAKMKQVAKGIVSLGIPPRSCIVISGMNSTKWVISFWGIVMADCLPVGVYPTNSSKACEQIVKDCQASLAFVEDKEQLDKFRSFSKSSSLVKLVTFLHLSTGDDDQVISFDSFITLDIKDSASELAIRRKAIRAGKAALLIYTSGTTGTGKGVLIAHDSFGFMTQLFVLIRVKQPSPPRILSYLPLSHIAALQFDVILTLIDGACLYFADKEVMKSSLPFYLEQVRPTAFMGVPRVWEKIEDKIKAQVEAGGGLKKKIFEWAIGVGEREFASVLRGEPPSRRYRLAKRLVFDKLKQKIGLDQCIEFVFGAAPMKATTRSFFFALGMPLNNCYGLSESTGAFTGLIPSELHEMQFTSCGRSYYGCEVSLGPEGEILLKGRLIFMGYLNRENETRESFDGPRKLKTGDVGKIDSKGNIYITGRIKEIIVTAGGENVAPIPLEQELGNKLTGISSAAVLIGDQKPFIIALIFFKNKLDFTQFPSEELDPEVVENLMKKGVMAKTYAQLFEPRNELAIHKLITEAVNAANLKAASNAAKVRRWALMPRDISLPTGELTPTFKLRRKGVEKNFALEIQRLYNEPKL